MPDLYQFSWVVYIIVVVSGSLIVPSIVHCSNFYLGMQNLQSIRETRQPVLSLRIDCAPAENVVTRGGKNFLI